MRPISRIRFIFAALVAIVLTCRPTLADTVLLKNGDRLTGELQTLEKKQLGLKTSYAGVIRIDWSAVGRVTTDEPRRVQMESGLVVVGIIVETGRGLQLQGAEQSTPLDLGVVISITAAPGTEADTFWRRLEGTADFGYSLTGGNSELSQSSLSLTARYRTDRYKLVADVASLFSTQNDTSTTSRHSGSLRYDYFLGPRVFTFALSGFERDERQRLNLRTNLGGGVGWKVLQSDTTELSLLGGFTYVREQFRVQDPALEPDGRSSGEGLAGLVLEKTVTRRVQLTSRLSFYPNTVEWGRYRLTLDGGARVNLVGRVTWSLRLFDRFDSDPPLRVQRNDYGLVSSFGWTF